MAGEKAGSLKIVVLTGMLALAGCDLFSASASAPEKEATIVAPEKQVADDDNQKKEKIMEEVAVITTRHGAIVIRLLDDVAPKHVASFTKLAKDGFYDGTSFHRVIPDFMIQGGDPNSKDAKNRAIHGTGGPGYTIPAEFSDLKHTRGRVSAARSQDPNSAGSQFFICVADSPWLDGQYSVFGEVIEGMDVVDKIVAEPRDARDNPDDRVEMTVLVKEAPAN
jgi:peptidyl-prolyl cis-trans isomerase B (cyclophilin B)